MTRITARRLRLGTAGSSCPARHRRGAGAGGRMRRHHHRVRARLERDLICTNDPALTVDGGVLEPERLHGRVRSPATAAGAAGNGGRHPARRRGRAPQGRRGHRLLCGRPGRRRRRPYRPGPDRERRQSGHPRRERRQPHPRQPYPARPRGRRGPGQWLGQSSARQPGRRLGRSGVRDQRQRQPDRRQLDRRRGRRDPARGRAQPRPAQPDRRHDRSAASRCAAWSSRPERTSSRTT